MIYDMAKNGEVDPWKIDIVDLTDRFLKKIDDLRVSGRAILYASLLLKMKSEVLLNEIYGEEDDLNVIEVEVPDYIDEVDLIDLKPVRRRVKRYTTLDELVKELRRLENLRDKRRGRKRSAKVLERLDEVPHEEDVEEKMMEVYESIRRLGMKEVSFTKLVEGFDRSLKVTDYVSILHLAYRKMLKVEQSSPYGDIRVIL